MKRVILFAALLLGATAVHAEDRASPIEIIASVKPALVGVGSHDPLRRPSDDLLGTGFAVADGQHVLTALHVVNSRGSTPGGKLVVFVGAGEDGEIRGTTKIAEDAANDIALLRIEGAALPVLSLHDGPLVPDGTDVIFSGFPVGAVYGLYPASHRAMIAARTPIARQSVSVHELTPDMIRSLKQKTVVYQLDGTTLPGNSGGPVIDLATGQVIALVNSAFVRETKEAGAGQSSGIGFAIPIGPALALIGSAGLTP